MTWDVEYTNEFEAWWVELWYEENIPKADALYDEHLEELKREGLL
jgi:hypothetical protein